jgi:hypothetical protein
MITRCKIGKGVTGAVRYILGEGRDPDSGELNILTDGEKTRIDWFGGIGFGFEVESRDDADLARRIMEFDAQNQSSRTRRCEMDCVHLSLCWRPGEQPTREQMATAAENALTAMGMGNARALFAAHNDEGYAHIHIVASKINPETGKAYDLKGNYLNLSRWAEAYEKEHSGGIVCTRREEANQLRDAIEKKDAGAVIELMTQQRATFKGRDLERVLSKQIKDKEQRGVFVKEILTRPEIVGSAPLTVWLPASGMRLTSAFGQKFSAGKNSRGSRASRRVPSVMPLVPRELRSSTARPGPARAIQWRRSERPMRRKGRRLSALRRPTLLRRTWGATVSRAPRPSIANCSPSRTAAPRGTAAPC